MITNDIKFYDTSSLLLIPNGLFDEFFVISSVTLSELEEIKSSRNKDFSIKAQARHLTRLLADHEGDYDVVIFDTKMLKPLTDKNLPINNDMSILACAINYDTYIRPDETIFVTEDLSLKNIANLFFGNDSIKSVSDFQQINEVYHGYKEFVPTEEELTDFYTNKNFNWFSLYPNQYLILRNQENEVIDLYCWTGETHRHLHYNDFYSMQFGPIKPYKGDIYQKLLFDSLYNNQLTLIGGPPGSGKSYISLAFLFDRLEKGIIDRIIIFCNPVAARNAAKLGFYPGDRTQKLIDSQVGGILSSKLGGTDRLMQLLDQEKIILMPAADARGYETISNSGVYIMEAQNLDITLMKMLIQRVGEDNLIIIDGDNARQIDLEEYSGENNGIKRVSEVFRGAEYFGQVDLQKVHRSVIAERAELM